MSQQNKPLNGLMRMKVYIFRNIYSFDHANYTNEFNYTKGDFCKITYFLPFMLTEILAIYTNVIKHSVMHF